MVQTKEPHLTYENQWEAHIYRVGGKRLKQLTEVKISGKKYKVTGYQDHRTYSDMGTQMSATTMQFSIKVEIHGAMLPIDLNELIERKVHVIPVSFKLEE